MVFTKNVAKAEKIIRIVLGIGIIPFGFFLDSFWKPLSLAVGAFLILTAFVGY